MAGCPTSVPVDGVIAYCDTELPPTVVDPKLLTNIQLSSARITIDFGPIPVPAVAGFDAVNAPDTGLIFSGLIVFDNVPNT